MATPLVTMHNISKSFPGVLANDRVNFELAAGEIHALLGENGSGKSTLMSILGGLYRPDQGRIYWQGNPVDLRSPRDAIRWGIGMVHQHFKLVETFTVTENIVLGDKRLPYFWRPASKERELAKLSARFGLDVDPQARIWQLSVGERQRVEIVKMLYRGCQVLILDEPTAVLTPQEANELFINLQHMKESGKSVVLITHKLDEVLAVADRVTILRAGRAVATRQRGSFSKEELAEAMVGRQLPPRPDRRRPVQDAVTLQLDNATAFGDAGQIALNNLSLQVHAGEILGIAGVAGNGQRELAEVVTGLRPLHKGTMYLAGENMTNRGVTALLNKGVSHVPEDRLGSGLVPNLDAVDNVLLRTYRHGTRPGLIDYRQARRQTEELVKAFSVQLASLGSPVKLLSGGNLQRLLLARELSAGPSLIVAVYPMRGLDIAAAEEVRRLLLRERDRGAAILLISEDLDDIFRLSDRIAVLSRGSLPVPPIAAQKANREEIGLLMMGHTEVATHG
ncbi:MAG TPA: ABC transporter ATP-binding protein [Firmicutes bacterium]|jgi:ABC-type uncharacterized transport system ATPase subunit|nr:ABC transporter ATP-binding protein [Bacillota bacterium]